MENDSVWWDMGLGALCGLLAIFTFLALGGCTGTKPETHWGPENRDEMRVLIGQTVMDAMFQIHQESLKELERNRKPDRLQVGTENREGS